MQLPAVQVLVPQHEVHHPLVEAPVALRAAARGHAAQETLIAGACTRRFVPVPFRSNVWEPVADVVIIRIRQKGVHSFFLSYVSGVISAQGERGKHGGNVINTAEATVSAAPGSSGSGSGRGQNLHVEVIIQDVGDSGVQRPGR